MTSPQGPLEFPRSGPSALPRSGPPAIPRAARHALFPGTFDPFTLGHLDLAVRARALFGRVTIGVARNPEKQPLFGAEERAELARAALRELPGGAGQGIEVALIPGLVVSACQELGADLIVRGVRSGSDFDLEAQMARTNRVLQSKVETVLLVPSPESAHVSSTLVRQIASLGGDVSALVPACVVRALQTKFGSKISAAKPTAARPAAARTAATRSSEPRPSDPRPLAPDPRPIAADPNELRLPSTRSEPECL